MQKETLNLTAWEQIKEKVKRWFGKGEYGTSRDFLTLHKMKENSTDLEFLLLTKEFKENGLKKSHNNEDSKLSKSEEDFFKPEMLSNIKNGEGYIIRNSIASPFMAKFIVQKSLYKTAKDDVALNRYVDIDVIRKKQIELGA